MKQLRTVLISGLLLPAGVMASPADDENAKLRAQVEQLKAQLQAAQSSCVASAASPAASSLPATASAAAPATPALPATPVVPATVSAPAETTALATPPPEKPVAKTEVPSGYKLVKIEPVIPKDNRWKDANAWDSLFKGMSKQEVESLLGVEHSVTEGSNRTFWGYGNIGVVYQGKVIFVDNRLAVWTKPDF
jgi:hypothetical protein